MKNKKLLAVLGMIFVVLIVASVTSVFFNSDEETKLSFVGDIMLSRNVGDKIDETNVKFPFSKVAHYLRDSDIAFGNLETQISDGEGIDWKSCCKFKAREEVMRGLVYSEIDVFSVANNHVLDFGPEAYENTISLLEEYDLSYVGVDEDGSRHSELIVIEIKGRKIGYLAYYDKMGENKFIGESSWLPQPVILEDEIFLKDIANADELVDVLVVSVHWGEEYKTEHNERQEYLAHSAVDNGADIVVGHHTHVVQEIEVYDGKIIAYSLGKFVFDQPTSETPVKEGVRDSVILDVFIDKDGNLSYSTEKIRINNNYQPEII